jgi:phage terminase large subunit GpA-like protein
MVCVSPRCRQPLSTWIEDVVRLPVGLAAEPGPIKLTPFMVEIADSIADPRVERITLQKSTRIGWTTLMGAAVGHFLTRDPSRVMALWPTEADARNWIIELENIFDGSPALRDALPVPHPGKRDRNSLLYRIADNGAALIVAGAGAPRRLRHHSARILMIDELDGIEQLAEGDVVGLAMQRTLSFPDRKILAASTPIDEATSHICRLYSQSDMRIWECRCPACRGYAEVRWADIEWPQDRPQDAAWRCPACRELIGEQHKTKMVSRGRWRAQRPEAGPSHRGYKINALVSPLANLTWGKIAQEFLKAKDSSDTLKVFVNCTLAEPWRDEADDVDDLALANRVENFGLDAIPAAVAFLTMGVDCQIDRVEASILGHGRDGTVYVLAHETRWGSPLDNEVWTEIDDLLKQRWKHPTGGQLSIDAGVVDSGGQAGVYDVVLKFCAARLGRKILAGKGVAGFARPAIVRAKTRGRALFIVGADPLKSAIISRLARGSSIRFSHTLTADYFEMLTAERKIVRMVRGRPTVRFERKPGMRAEALDCMVYGLAARAALSLSAASFDQRESALRAPIPDKPAPPTVIKSQWMERGRWQ